MKVKLKCCLAVLLFYQPHLFALERTLNLSVYIAKDTSSSDISVSTDKKNYSTLYNKNIESFDDINMLVTVSAPVSSPSSYDIVLKDMSNYCDDVALTDVATMLNGIDFIEGDKKRFTEYDTVTATDQWSEHQFTLSFPMIPRRESMQNCTGHVAISVETVI